MPDENTETPLNEMELGMIGLLAMQKPQTIVALMERTVALEKQNAELRAALEEERNLKGVAHDIMMHERLRGDDLERALEVAEKNSIHETFSCLNGEFNPRCMRCIARAALRGKERA